MDSYRDQEVYSTLYEHIYGVKPTSVDDESIIELRKQEVPDAYIRGLTEVKIDGPKLTRMLNSKIRTVLEYAWKNPTGEHFDSVVSLLKKIDETRDTQSVYLFGYLMKNLQAENMSYHDGMTQQEVADYLVSIFWEHSIIRGMVESLLEFQVTIRLSRHFPASEQYDKFGKIMPLWTKSWANYLELHQVYELIKRSRS